MNNLEYEKQRNRKLDKNENCKNEKQKSEKQLKI